MIKGVLNDRLEPMVVVEISNGDGDFQTFESLFGAGFTEDLTLLPRMRSRVSV